MSEIPFRNPGWAGNVGEYDLTEEQVRGTDFVGVRPLEGGHPAASATYPFMLEEKDPEAPLFEGPYEARFEKILTRYPTKRAALLPALNLARSSGGTSLPRPWIAWGNSSNFHLPTCVVWRPSTRCTTSGRWAGTSSRYAPTSAATSVEPRTCSRRFWSTPIRRWGRPPSTARSR